MVCFVNKTCTVVRVFRKSPVKNDEVLKPLVIKEHGKQLKLVLDCKTRRSSLLSNAKKLLSVTKASKSSINTARFFHLTC